MSFTFDHAWLEIALRVLTHTGVAAMLLMTGLLGTFMEFKVPGFGFPGIAGITCLTLFFASQYLVGHAAPLEILLFLVGLILIVLEVAVIPGFGVVGVAGIGCTLLGLVLSVQAGGLADLRSPAGRAALLEALVTVSGGLIGFGIGVLALLRVLPRTPGLHRLVLKSDVAAQANVTVRLPEDAELIGRRGRALSDLRPTGKVSIGDRVLDAATRGDYMEAGRAVRVIRIDGNRVLVEAADTP